MFSGHSLPNKMAKITSLYSNHTWLSLKECKLTIRSLHDIVQARNDWAQVSSLDARKVK